VFSTARPDIATADIATADIATADIATADIATADIATADAVGGNAFDLRLTPERLLVGAGRSWTSSAASLLRDAAGSA
jgi:hypothetical protein